MVTAGQAAGCAVPLQVHQSTSGHRHVLSMSAGRGCSPPLHGLSAPAEPYLSSCEAAPQQAEGRLPLLSHPAPKAPPPIHESLQESTLPKAPVASGMMEDPVQDLTSAVPQPAAFASSASAVMPGSVRHLVNMVNNQMGAQQVRHHITEAQAFICKRRSET